jgi:hypothetical protein
MQTPASVYEPSPRQYPARVSEPDYPDTMLVRTVKSHGHFRSKRKDVFLSEVTVRYVPGLKCQESPPQFNHRCHAYHR